MCHHELWPASVSHLFPFRNTCLRKDELLPVSERIPHRFPINTRIHMHSMQMRSHSNTYTLHARMCLYHTLLNALACDAKMHNFKNNNARKMRTYNRFECTRECVVACAFRQTQRHWKWMVSLGSVLLKMITNVYWCMFCCCHGHHFKDHIVAFGVDADADILSGAWQSLKWRHNRRDGVSNHHPHDCLLNRLFRRRSEKAPKLRVTGLCAGNSPVAENVSILLRHHGGNTIHLIQCLPMLRFS